MALETCLRDVILHIYQMEPGELARYAVFAALIFCALHRIYVGKPWFRTIMGGVLAVWLGAVLWLTVLNRSGGSTYLVSWISLGTYWRVLRGENVELLRSSFMNGLLFYPAGLLLKGLLPKAWSFRKGMLCTVLVFGLLSLEIELSQYLWQCGNCELDDVLHNTLGAAVGFVAFRLDLNDDTINNGQ